MRMRISVHSEASFDVRLTEAGCAILRTTYPFSFWLLGFLSPNSHSFVPGYGRRKYCYDQSEHAVEVYSPELNEKKNQQRREHGSVEKVPRQHERAEPHELFQDANVYSFHEPIFSVWIFLSQP